MKSKRKFFDSLDARWQKAYRRVVRHWTQVVRRGGRRSTYTGCALCKEAEFNETEVGVSDCKNCILVKFLRSKCTSLPDWRRFSGANLDLQAYKLSPAGAITARKTCLKAARAILRKLKDALPKRDKVCVVAERVLEKTK